MNDFTTRRKMLQAAPAVFGVAGLASVAAAQDGGGSEMMLPRTVADTFKAAHDGQKYALPPLPYPADALEPHIDAQTMRLHHDKHHQGYVDGLNAAVEALAKAPGEADAELYGLERNLSFNGGGHVLHTYFWATMSPDGGGQPQGALGEAINSAYGSFDAFKNYFTAVAKGVKGSGWGLLAYEPVGDNLVVCGLNEHDTKLLPGSVPLLPVDVWEHAYYLKYQNERGKYLDNWFQVIDWPAVGALYELSRAMTGGQK